MKKINIGIIGCGHWGPNFVRNFTQMPQVNLMGVCDANPEKLFHLRHKYPGLTMFHAPDDLLKNQKLDAVVISTPASTHYRLTKEALSANKHVLVEKPISLKIKEAQELIRISKKQNRILMVGHTFLFNPSVNKAKELIKKKELGKVYYIHSRRTNLGPLRKDVNAIWDLSLHDISILNYLLEAMPLEVRAYGQRFLSHKLEDVGFIILKYPKNILAHIHVSWLDPKKVRETTIIGSKKMLVYDDININEPIKVYDKRVMKKKYEEEYEDFEGFQLIIRDGKMDTPKVLYEEPLKLECRHFIDCIRNNKRPLTDGGEGLNIIKILGQIEKSCKTNKTVKIK